MSRIALGLEYDGSAFTGWQSQPDGRGVQDALEQALAALAGVSERVAVHAAGRTDTGVHASLQVVHFDAPIARPDEAWVRGTNAHLPAAVSVLWMRHVPSDFHARFSAQERTYVYQLLVRPSRPALYAQHLGWFHRPLDVDAMRRAATHLLGTHDFSSFRSSQCQAKSPVRTLTQLDIAVTSPERITFTLRANAFLHHMVRNLVGALVYVGKGAHPPEWMGDLLHERDRRRAAPTFSPAGLTLADIAYDARFGLPRALPRPDACDHATHPYQDLRPHP